jgi:ribokinase
MPQSTIIVVGSLHYDIMVQAPHRPTKGETVTGSAWFPKFGGKGGNQAVAAARAGAEVRMVGAVGQDNFADYLLHHLAEGGVETTRIARTPLAGSGMSVATMDAEGDYGAVIVSGANLHIFPAALADEALWTGASLLILQNEIPEAINTAAATAARHHGIKVCLNAAPMRPMSPALTSLIDILIANTVEAEALTGHPVPTRDAALKAAQTLAQSYPTAIVTAGGDGGAWVSGTGSALWDPIPVTLVSTHGAGDTFVGTLCAALGTGQPLPNAIQTANRAAADHVSARR